MSATSESYQDYLISSLQNPAEAAVYLEVHLEKDEDWKPELLQMALENVAEALAPSQMSAEQAEVHRQSLTQILSQPGSEAVYGLANWLAALGLKLTVTTANSEQER